ncbi:MULTISPECIES: hypothetical protein [unclassified Streptomyces]|uniref:hypothetical protein n=1 Tax=unclassified Streptomyces TaxID=2593676 RepID=UPI002271E1B0|nr:MULTISPECIES: hypothetical protein [unclassified Streptomyces]MCY0919613.1 hypothetical protein [Streptomyces sp. H27-G5]MCY0957205.1 hypothetical protein [Streptomyces sp. H27-H5]
MSRHYLRGYVLRAEKAEEPEAGKPLRIIAATAGRKGDGLNLTMEGADLGRFQSNPVVGYGHQYWGREGLPIGRSEKTWIDGDKLMMDIAFDPEDDFARTVERKYRGGYLNAFSIGFDVWDVDDSGTPRGWELFEVSAVPLPMDPNAIVESGRELAVVRALDELALGGLGRAGAVLSKKNLGLVENAVTALQELLAAAQKSDDEDPEDPERGIAPTPQPADLTARMRRLAGI